MNESYPETLSDSDKYLPDFGEVKMVMNQAKAIQEDVNRILSRPPTLPVDDQELAKLDQDRGLLAAEEAALEAEGPQLRSPVDVLLHHELDRARAKYPDRHFQSGETARIIFKKAIELDLACKLIARNMATIDDIEKYAIQVGAMAIRLLEDSIGVPKEFYEEVFVLTDLGRAEVAND